MLNKILSLVQYASDLHLERGFKRNLIAKRPNLVLCGDIGYPFQDEYKKFLLSISQDFDKVFVLSGNHEYDIMNKFNYSFTDIDNQIENICDMRNNLIYLQKKKFTLCENDNVDLIGCTMWTKKPVKKLQLHQEHLEFLEKSLKEGEKRNMIVATHHCPSFEVLDPKFRKNSHIYFADDTIINKFYKNKEIKNNLMLWLYGHSHINKTKFFSNTLLSSNQYGYKEKPINGFWF
jgi:hypothetical protein